MTDISEITEDEWRQYQKRLTLHARNKFFRLGWVSKHGCKAGPQGVGPEDVASEAIIKVIEGKRKYNKEEYPDFKMFLRSVVDSIVSNMLNLAERKKLHRLPNVGSDSDETRTFELEDNQLSPLNNLMNKEVVDEVNAVLMTAFSTDNIVCGILECLRAGIMKPSEMAEYLEVNIKDVNNAQKRLRRVIETKLQDFRLEY